jgi:hypothetical protein
MLVIFPTCTWVSILYGTWVVPFHGVSIKGGAMIRKKEGKKGKRKERRKERKTNKKETKHAKYPYTSYTVNT